LNKRSRYQLGSLSRRKRAKTGGVWQFRYYAFGPDGRRERKTLTVGSTDQYPNKSDAMRVVESLRLRINADQPVQLQAITMAGLIEQYIAQELPQRYSTQRSYLSVLRGWIEPKWGEYPLAQVKTIAVEQWLRSLSLAPKTKTHIRNLMHLLYENARRWELIERNPIELVRQSSRRLSIPRVLRVEEVRKLLQELKEPYRTMVLVAVCLGLRVSEIMGLQWGDFDWENSTVLVQRSVVHARVGETKTEYSRRPMPLDPALKEALVTWREQCFYGTDSDWVFANDAGRPRWQETILERQLKPAALRAEIGKIGWHTFRHTYSTMLRSCGVDVKVQQELLRHADIQTTLNVYTQAVSEAKRDANSKVVRMVLPMVVQNAEKAATGDLAMNGS
jgi:integrase